MLFLHSYTWQGQGRTNKWRFFSSDFCLRDIPRVLTFVVVYTIVCCAEIKIQFTSIKIGSQSNTKVPIKGHYWIWRTTGCEYIWYNTQCNNLDSCRRGIASYYAVRSKHMLNDIFVLPSRSHVCRLRPAQRLRLDRLLA